MLPQEVTPDTALSRLGLLSPKQMLPFGLSVGVLAGIVYLQPERTVGEMLVVFAASTIALVGWARLVATLTNQLTRSEQRAQFTFDQRMAGIALIGDGESPRLSWRLVGLSQAGTA